MSVACLDFSKFTQGSTAQRTDCARALVQSFIDHGFVKLVNHGVTDETIDQLQTINSAFFDLPDEKKEAVINPPSPHPQRGWSFKGAETTSGLREHKTAPKGRLTDEKEHYDIGPSDDTAFPNKWPTKHMPEFRQFLEPLYEKFQELCLDIMAACEVGLGIPENSLVDRCQPAASELRLNYYPEVSFKTLREGRTKRGWPHTDFGIITLLFQDQVGGLELQDRSQGGTASDVFVPLLRGPQSSEMAVNVSDTFQRWTNDVIRAGVHRVDIPPNLNLNDEEGFVPRRHSTVFFFKADRRTSVGPLPYFVSSDRPMLYEEMNALQFHEKMTQILIKNV